MLFLGFSLFVILLSCKIFTNGIEWLGKKIKVGDGVTGSIFSAIGTCLPETMIPIIAILFSGKNGDGEDIGIGAILGAPFMLSSLAFFVLGASVFMFYKKRNCGIVLKVNIKILSRDILFFLSAYIIALFAAYLENNSIKNIFSFSLIGIYFYYIFITFKKDNLIEGNLEKLYINRLFKKKSIIPSPSIIEILIQVVFAISGIIAGAYLFVENIKEISYNIGISPLLLSLVITPIATELPEKFNSIIWISQKKDTLAIGNITGAMVFQSCIPVSIGIIFTDWSLNPTIILSVLFAMLSSILIFIYIKACKKLTAFPLLLGGVFYLLFIFYMLKNVF